MNAIFLRMQMECLKVVEHLKSASRGGGLRRLVKDERAVSVIEYAILLGVIVGATTLAVGTFGGQISAAISTIADNVTTTVSTIGST